MFPDPVLIREYSTDRRVMIFFFFLLLSVTCFKEDNFVISLL